MVFYQFGADNYNDNRWDTMAVGNDSTMSFKMGGKTYSASLNVHIRQTGYMSARFMEVPGSGMWLCSPMQVTTERLMNT